MTGGSRRAIRNSASQLRGLSRTQLENALVIQRSRTVPEVVAALIEPDIDVDEIARVARVALEGDRRAALRFRALDSDLVNSLARILCLGGESGGLAQGIDLLRAQVACGTQSALPRMQKLLLGDGLILRGFFDEADAWLSSAALEGAEYDRYALAIRNPFRINNPQSLPVNDWVKLFNRFMSPSGSLAPVELAGGTGVPPFDQLSAIRTRSVDGPLITVVMSSFRPDESIFGAMRSILNQTWNSLELLVVDDGSGPEFADIYERISTIDPRVKVVRQRVNGGTYLNRNRALLLARGSFIAFQDDDDWSHPERLERQMEPLLRDPTLMATQSWCFRTDDELDPVKIGYRKHLRRNESSLLFRSDVVRRIGFFHYSRKGGDSEYRMRMEAAFGRPVEMVGEEALAIIRLTPGSLSRDEFAAGFRHPSRLIYTECYKLIHARSIGVSGHYRTIHEYRDNFVPEKFQPRRRSIEEKYLDVVIAADLRDCTPGDDAIVSVATRLRNSGMRVGVAHYVGLRFTEFRVDRLSPVIADLFVQGIAEPVDFGEDRTVGSVIVSDAALLGHFPWKPTTWTVGEVFVRRGTPDNSSDMYDDATANYTALRLFGVRPTWFTARSQEKVLLELERHTGGYARPRPLHKDIRHHIVGSGEGRAEPSKLASCSVSVPSQAMVERDMREMVRTPSGVPYSVSRSDTDGRWCVVIGWPSFGYEAYAEPPHAARALLEAWFRGREVLEQRYADLGGSCLVVLGDNREVTVRTTSLPIGVRRAGNTLVFSSPQSAAFERVLNKNNIEELVLSAEGPAEFRPIATPVSHYGSLLDELQTILAWDVSMNQTAVLPKLLLDDNIESSLVLGLLRDSIEHVELVVRRGTSRVAKFLRSRFVQFSVFPGVSSELNRGNGATRSLILEPLFGVKTFATSYRARRLLDAALKSKPTSAELDILWNGLGAVTDSLDTKGEAQEIGNFVRQPSANFPRLIDDVPNEIVDVPNEIVDATGETSLLRIAPNIARGEELPLHASLRRGTSDRLVVVLAPESSGPEGLSPTVETCSGEDLDSFLVLEDTTPVGGCGYGWFYGTDMDNLVLRHAQLVRRVADYLNCAKLVVSGGGRTSVPSVLLASLLSGADVLVVEPEAVAGEANAEELELLASAVSPSQSLDHFMADNAHRLRMRDVLLAAPPRMRLILVSDGDSPSLGVSLVASDSRTMVFAEKVAAWRFALGT